MCEWLNTDQNHRHIFTNKSVSFHQQHILSVDEKKPSVVNKIWKLIRII